MKRNRDYTRFVVTTFLDRMRSDTGLDYDFSPEQNRWVVDIRYGIAPTEVFSVEILLLEDWISFTSAIMKNFEGKDLDVFYEFVSRVNSQLNGVKLGTTADGQFLTIQSEIPISETLTAIQLIEILELFQDFYTKWPKILKKVARKCSLRFRRRTKDAVDELMNKYQLLDIEHILPTGEKD